MHIFGRARQTQVTLEPEMLTAEAEALWPVYIPNRTIGSSQCQTATEVRLQL